MLFKSMPCAKPLFLPSKQYITTVFYSFVATVVTLDVWFEREVKPRLGGEAVLVRYCDDFVIGFERREDAQRVAEVLGKRMERFGLRLHPEKTRLIAFERPEAGQRSGKGRARSSFSGSRCTGDGRGADAGRCGARHGARA